MNTPDFEEYIGIGSLVLGFLGIMAIAGISLLLYFIAKLFKKGDK